MKVSASDGIVPSSRKILRLSRAHSLSESLNSYCVTWMEREGEGGRKRGRRGGGRGRTGACQSVFAALREYRDSDVPAERSELLPLLNDSMEETQTKDYFLHVTPSTTTVKKIVIQTALYFIQSCVLLHVYRYPDYLVIIVHLTMIFNE